MPYTNEELQSYDFFQKLRQQDKRNYYEKISTLYEIWHGNETNKVREKQLVNKGEDINICKNCSFKDVYEWI